TGGGALSHARETGSGDRTGWNVKRPRPGPSRPSSRDEEVRMQRQVKAKSLSVKIPKNEPTTVRLNSVLANEEFLTLELPRYALERFIVQAKRAIEEAPLLSRKRSSGYRPLSTSQPLTKHATPSAPPLPLSPH